MEGAYPRALFNLAWCYEHGKGVPRDLLRARELYRAAAEQQYEGAQAAADRLAKRAGSFLRDFLGGLRGR